MPRRLEATPISGQVSPGDQVMANFRDMWTANQVLDTPVTEQPLDANITLRNWITLIPHTMEQLSQLSPEELKQHYPNFLDIAALSLHNLAANDGFMNARRTARTKLEQAIERQDELLKQLFERSVSVTLLDPVVPGTIITSEGAQKIFHDQDIPPGKVAIHGNSLERKLRSKEPPKVELSLAQLGKFRGLQMEKKKFIVRPLRLDGSPAVTLVVN